MTRIEKTKINISAFIILSSILEEVQSDHITEIIDNGRDIVKRSKKENEKEAFLIDLTFLNKLSEDLLKGSQTIIIDNEDEKYLRNCSFACYYYRNENDRKGEFDHFDLFHNIHFANRNTSNIENDILKQLCGLFRIDYKLCLPFINCEKNIDRVVKLPSKVLFNQIFDNIIFKQFENLWQVTFESYTLNMMESLDSLFCIKDLFSCRGIDTKSIPEYNCFSIQENEEVKFSFKTVNGHKIIISFKYNRLIVDIIKNCIVI